MTLQHKHTFYGGLGVSSGTWFCLIRDAQGKDSTQSGIIKSATQVGQFRGVLFSTVAKEIHNMSHFNRRETTPITHN